MNSRIVNITAETNTEPGAVATGFWRATYLQCSVYTTYAGGLQVGSRTRSLPLPVLYWVSLWSGDFSNWHGAKF